MAHADLPDAGRVSHFEIDGQLPTPDEKGALAGDPVPPSDANRYLTQNHAAGGFDGFANPTASVGLVAVNGVATTAMRSDGAPALDQAIIPTWTGLHTFRIEDGVVGAITYANRLGHITSGAAAPLFGVGQKHELEDAGGAVQVASEVVTLWATATAGAESPLWRVSTYPVGAVGPGYMGFWTWNDLDDNVRTIIPNGAGDVTSGVTIMYRIEESGGGAEGNVVMVANGGAVDLYDDGVDVFTLTVNANGSVTVVRSAGATTADLSLLMCWL